LSFFFNASFFGSHREWEEMHSWLKGLYDIVGVRKLIKIDILIYAIIYCAGFISINKDTKD